MCVYVCMCVCLCVYLCMHVCPSIPSTRPYACLPVCLYVCVFVFMLCIGRLRVVRLRGSEKRGKQAEYFCHQINWHFILRYLPRTPPCATTCIWGAVSCGGCDMITPYWVCHVGPVCWRRSCGRRGDSAFGGVGHNIRKPMWLNPHNPITTYTVRIKCVKSA